MSWRNRDWPASPPRPKVAKLSREALQRLHARAVEFVEKSALLGELLQEVKLARGRLYFWWELEDLMARITPLGPDSMLLEAPHGKVLDRTEARPAGDCSEGVGGGHRGDVPRARVPGRESARPQADDSGHPPSGNRHPPSRSRPTAVLVLDAPQAGHGRGQQPEGPRSRSFRGRRAMGLIPRDLPLRASWE